MRKLPILLVTVFSTLFAGVATPQVIDLTQGSELELLRTLRPQHYDVVRQIQRGLGEQPGRVEGNWLALTFGASDVQRGPLKSDGGIDSPTQTIRFKLGDSAYRLTVLRTDITAYVNPQQQTLLP